MYFCVQLAPLHVTDVNLSHYIIVEDSFNMNWLISFIKRRQKLDSHLYRKNEENHKKGVGGNKSASKIEKMPTK